MIKEETAKHLALLFLAVKYDKDERELMIKTTCKPYLSIETEEREDLIEYIARHKELLEQALLTEEDEIELDFLESWVQENAIKFQIQKSAIALSIFMVIGKYMDRRIQGVLNLCRRNGGTSEQVGQVRTNIYMLGEQVSGVPWSRYIWAMGNYIRHHHQWDISTLDKQMVNGKQEIVRKKLAPEDIRGHGKKTILVLNSLGIPLDRIVNKTHDISSEVVELLELHDADKNLSRIEKWIDDLKEYTVKEFLQ